MAATFSRRQSANTLGSEHNRRHFTEDISNEYPWLTDANYIASKSPFNNKP